jgi:hypothetical protein
MATEEEDKAARRSELAQAVAEGLSIFQSAQEEAKAKADAENKGKEGGNGDDGTGGDKSKRTLSEWLLG